MKIMKKKLTRKVAEQKIHEFFSKKDLDAEHVKKIKRLAMSYNIKLGLHRKRFCRKCLNDLKRGKVRISKTHKTVECINCGEKNKWKITTS